MALLQVENLHFSYPGKKILNGLDLQIDPGEIFCIFGTNGCGKTTLLDCILGLHSPSHGRMMIDGKDATGMSAAQKAKNMAYVSQKSNRTFPYTVLEMVLMGRTAYSGLLSSPGKKDVLIAEEALDSLGMLSFRNRVYTQLSGGEAQLIKIARAIAQEANLIIFDEPTTHLDFRHELNVIKYIMDIVQQKKISAIIATHAPNHAFFFESHGLPTRVALMQDGLFAASGTPAEVLTSENMAEIFRVIARNFTNTEGDMMHNFMMPVDFCNEGDRNHA